jgi:hypothetical protein
LDELDSKSSSSRSSSDNSLAKGPGVWPKRPGQGPGLRPVLTDDCKEHPHGAMILNSLSHFCSKHELNQASFDRHMNKHMPTHNCTTCSVDLKQSKCTLHECFMELSHVFGGSVELFCIAMRAFLARFMKHVIAGRCDGDSVF